MSEELGADVRKEVADKLREQKLADARLEKEVKRLLEVKQGISTGYVDPAIGEQGRTRPKYKDGTELGRKLYDRIKHKLHGGIQ